jgi:hypothetical protein
MEMEMATPMIIKWSTAQPMTMSGFFIKYSQALIIASRPLACGGDEKEDRAFAGQLHTGAAMTRRSASCCATVFRVKSQLCLWPG